MRSKLMVVVFALSVVGFVPCAHARCSRVTLTGTWGFTTTGTIILPVIGPAPVGAVGHISFDGAGGVSGEQTRSVGGQVAQETFSGTYTVNGDCSADFTVQVFLSGTFVRASTVHLILDNNLLEIRAIFTSSALPDGTPLPSILTAQAKRVGLD
jgi:hypothetical protein